MAQIAKLVDQPGHAAGSPACTRSAAAALKISALPPATCQAVARYRHARWPRPSSVRWKLAATRCANCVRSGRRIVSRSSGWPTRTSCRQLVLVGVDVGEHAQLFQALAAQVLRLVEDQDHPAAGRSIPRSGRSGTARTDRHRSPPAASAGPAPAAPSAEARPGRHGRWRSGPTRTSVVQRFQQVMQQRGLARPHLAGDQRDRRAGQQPVFQHREGAAVRRRPVQEIRIGHQRERPLGQAEMLGIDSRAC